MADTDALGDADILARTCWGEARGEQTIGMIAVASVVMNRVRNPGWWGHDVRTVCLKPYQFSCWLTSDTNRPKLMAVTQDDAQFAAASNIAAVAISGSISDVTAGADSYYDKRMATPPKWANDLIPCAEIGHHLFFRTVE